MTRYKLLRLYGSAASATLLFLFSSACLVSGIRAQSAESTRADSSQSYTAPSPFLVAPSFPLGYAPSSVAAGDLTGSGKLDLVAADYTSGNITVLLGTGQGNFSAPVEYPAGPRPNFVLVADINGDGKPDVVVSNESESTISVLLGRGDGTLQPLQSYAVGFKPSFLAAGSFNGDGKTDVAVAGESSSQLAIFLNDGNGNLQKPILYSLPKTPMALTTADFNNDGHIDLALANADGTVSILLGQGGGVFHPLQDIRVASGSLSSIVAGDFNKDGKIDLAVTQPGQKLVSVLIGKGDGTFASPASYPVGSEPVSTVVADVDGDGVADLIVINNASNTFSILGGNGDGTFKSSLDFVAGNAPLAAVAGDFYGNGHVDLAIINHSSQTVSVPLGNGDGTFKAGRSYFAGQEPISIASGNLAGNKIPALAVTNYCGSDPSCSTAGNVAVFLADGKSAYQLSSTYTVGAGPVSVALADLNGDKNLDIVALNRLDKTASVLLGVGDGTFRQPIALPLAGAPVAFAVGDFNKDGKPDLAVLEDCGSAKCSQPGSLEILLGGGDGSFQSALSYPVGYSPSSLAVGNINGDKNLDILVANRCGKDASCQSPGTATVLIGDGTGKFKPGTDVTLGNSPSSIALGNLSGSGLDLLVSRSTDNTVAVLHGNGDGTFRAAVPYQVGNQPRSLVVADFNGDGKADVAVTNFNDSTVSILYGNGDGTLRTATALSVGTGPEGLTAIAGATGGHASLATANGNSGSPTLGTDVTVLANGSLATGTTGLSAFTLVPSPNPSTVNQQVTLTATVLGSPTSAAPTGTVVFYNGTTAMSDCAGSSGEPLTAGGVGEPSTATCTTSSLLAPSDSLTAGYSGDGTYASATSSAVTQTVNAEAATFTLTSSTGAVASNVNSSVTFTATVTPTGATGAVFPSGQVTFSIVGKHGTTSTTISDCTTAVTVNSSGAATCTTNKLIAGTDTVTATYGGDTNFTVSPASPQVVQTVNAEAATIAIKSSTGTTASNVNDSVTFTATVTPTGSTGGVLPSGQVTFTIVGKNGTTSTTISDCTTAVTVNSLGVATCTTNKLIAGTDTVTATYGGDTNFTLSPASAQVVQTVNAEAATFTLASSTGAVASNVNSSVTFTATVTPTGSTGGVLPSGQVTFTIVGKNGTTSTTISDCTTAVTVNGSGAATCTTSKLIAGTDTVTATYGGDTNFTLSPASPQVVQTVNALAATLGLTASPSTSVSTGTSVKFTAQLAASALAPVNPSGTVSFTINGSTDNTDCPAVTVSSGGSATCTTASLVAPADVIVATYSADTNFTVAAPASITETVGKTAAQTMLTSSPTSPAVNQQVTLTATVTPPSSSSTKVLPTGNVTFTQGSTTLCSTVTINANTGVANCSYVFTSAIASPGSTITATYSGDSNFSAGTPATVSEIVVASGTMTSLVSTPNPSSVGGAVTFTATVTPTYTAGTAKPTGTVVFSDTTTTTTLCTETLSSGTVPVCSYTFNSSGTNSVVATYTSADANFTGSASAPKADVQTVNAGATSIGLTSAPAASTVNEQVTFTATINAANSGTTVPTGTMIYSDGSTTLCTVTLAVSTGAVPTCTVPLSPAGTHSITAAYSGDSNFKTATSSVLPQFVTQTATTTTVVSVPSSSSVNQPVTFTATVTTPTIPAYAGSTPETLAVPTGSVLFSYTQGAQSGVLCTGAVTLVTTGSVTSAQCVASLPATGTYAITATYNGDSNFLKGPSAPLSQAVGSPSTTVTVTSQPTSSVVNQPVSFTAVIKPAFGGTTEPSGTVTFTDTSAGNTLCTETVSATGTVPACTAALLTAATHTITATYNGDTNFAASLPAALNELVNPAPTAVTLVSSLPTSVATQSVTFTATVMPSPTGATSPTGKITFTSSDGTVNTCGAVPVTVPGNGTAKASCMVPFPLTTGGQVSVSASYSGDINFVANSGSFAQTVQNFSVAFSSPASDVVLLTQGYSNVTDPFVPTQITVVSTPVGGFSDPLKVTCAVINTSTSSPVSDPSCSPLSATLPGNSGSLGYTISASSSAAPGAYSVTLTAIDSNTSALVQTTVKPLAVYVVGVSGPIIVAPGVAATQSAVFNTATPPSGQAPTTLSSFKCGTLVNVATGSEVASTGLTCTGPSGGVTVPAGAQSVTVSITITDTGSTTAQMQRSSTVSMAALLGIPLLALVGWFGSRKSPRKNFFRFLGLILLILGLSYATGCGGSFTSTGTPPSSGGIAPGSYLVQVVATDQNGANYYAVVPLTVNSN